MSREMEDSPPDGLPEPIAPSPKVDEPLVSPESASYTPSYWFLFVVTMVNLVADVASKQWTKAHFEALRAAAVRKIVIIDGVMNFIYAKNKGGAWGLLQGSADALRRPFFLIVSVAAIVFIISLYRQLTPEQRALKWGLPLVLGGALGNLIDRIIYGFVIDFIDVYITEGGRERHWPTFNVADIAICVGVGLMAVDMFTSKPPKKDTPEEQKEPESEPFSTRAVAGASATDSPGSVPPDAVPPDAVPPDAVPPDAVAPDAVPPDAVPPDAVAPDEGGSLETDEPKSEDA